MTAWQIALVICGVVGGLSLISLFLWLSNNLIRTTRYNVAFSGVGSNKIIVQLSDLHGKVFGKDNAKLIDRVTNLCPDVIAITGDIIHKYTERNIRTALQTVVKLSKIAPVVYISGNHEMRSIKYRQLRKQLAKAGATVVDNREEEVAGIKFVGLNGAHNKNGTLLKITDNPHGKVLLAHMPHCIENYANADYEIVLSGHAHGGQWRIPVINQGIYAPGQWLFPRLTQGIHKRGNTKMIISRGLGNSQFPFRLYNCPEIVVIALEPEKSN